MLQAYWKIIITYVDRVRRTYATLSSVDEEDVTLVFYSGLRLAQTVLYLEAYPGLKNDMQSQGAKTIAHMKSTSLC